MSWLLAADIGGTNLRLRAYDGDKTRASEEHATGGPGELADIFGDFADHVGSPPAMVVAAAAGPVSDNKVRLTNAAKSLCGEDIKTATGATDAFVINDFAAAAWATDQAPAQDLLCLQGAAAPASESIHVVLGPGTGLGVGVLINRDGVHYAMPGEGGHVALAPHTPEEVPVFEAFRMLWPEVFYGDGLTCESEAMLSGTGLPLLYRAVLMSMGETGQNLDARGVLEAARQQNSPAAKRATAMFKSHLARLGGDLGLAAGAQSVFLVGGVATKNPWLFDDSFVNAFNAGGRFTPMRRNMNLYLLRNPDFGLLGARNYARYRLSLLQE